MNKNTLNDVRQLMLNHQMTDALTLIKQCHIDYHDQAINHLKVHILWFSIGYKMANLKIMAGQILPLIFALPVSFFHRCLGVAIKAHKPE